MPEVAGPAWARRLWAPVRGAVPARVGAAEAAPAALAAVAGVAVVLQLAVAGRLVIGHSKPAAAGVARVAPVPTLALTPALTGLFGVAAVTPAAAEAVDTSLVLTAVIATGDPARGFGVLGASAQATAVYAVGAPLPGGARLAEVYDDHVVVERAGAREIVRLPLTALHERRPRVEEAPVAVAAQLSKAEREGAAKALQFYNESQKPKARARTWLGQLYPDEVRRDDGRFLGVSITPPRPLRRKLGVQMGDVVTAIDGVPLTGTDQAVDLLSGKLGEATQITVLRGGSPLTLTVSPGQ